MRNSVSVCWVKSGLGWESYKLARWFGAYGLEQYNRLVENTAQSFYVSRWPPSHLAFYSWNPNTHVVGKTKEPMNSGVVERGEDAVAAVFPALYPVIKLNECKTY